MQGSRVAILGLLIAILVYKITPWFIVPASIAFVGWVVARALKTSNETIVQAWEDSEDGARVEAEGVSDN